MKIIIRSYRLLKPIAVYTSYLFTALTVLYLLAQTVFTGILPCTAGVLWGILFFSLGSICLQRLILGNGYLEGISYGIRLLMYLGAAGLWGYACLRVPEWTGWGGEHGYRVLDLMLLAGLCGCAGFELFNRYRAHMYNRLLDQYKKRKRV